MKLRMLSFFLFAILIIVGAGFAWLAISDMPVSQREIIVDVPITE